MEDKASEIRLSANELVILLNAINEAREALEDWEFPIRMGFSPVEAEALRQKLKAALQSLQQ